jgi:hypothetical protein
MEQKPKKKIKVKPLKEVRTKPNRVHGKDWLFSGQSKNFPRLLDIRYEKDLKLQESLRKKRGKTIMPKTLFRKPKMLD